MLYQFWYSTKYKFLSLFFLLTILIQSAFSAREITIGRDAWHGTSRPPNGSKILGCDNNPSSKIHGCSQWYGERLTLPWHEGWTGRGLSGAVRWDSYYYDITNVAKPGLWKIYEGSEQVGDYTYTRWRTDVLPRLKNEELPRSYIPRNANFTSDEILSSKLGLVSNDKLFTSVSVRGWSGGVGSLISVTKSDTPNLNGEIWDFRNLGYGKRLASYYDYRGDNLVTVREYWDYKDRCGDHGDQFYRIFVQYRMWPDFQKYAVVSTSEIFLMGAGRSLYRYDSSGILPPFGDPFLTESQILKLINNHGIHVRNRVLGNRIFNGRTIYLRDLAISSNGALAYILYEKNDEGIDLGTNPRVIYDVGSGGVYEYETAEKIAPPLPNRAPFSLAYGGGTTLYLIDEAHQLYFLNGTNWVRVETPEPVFRVSLGNMSSRSTSLPQSILVIGDSGKLYLALSVTYLTAPFWIDTGLVVKDADIGWDGSLALISGTNKLYVTDLAGVGNLTTVLGVTSGSNVLVGDPSLGLIYKSSDGRVFYGNISQADEKAQFTFESAQSGFFYLKQGSAYLTTRGRLNNELTGDATVGTLLSFTTTKNDNCKFIAENLNGLIYIRHLATGGYLTALANGLLSAVDPSNGFRPFTSRTTVLPVVAISPNINILTAARSKEDFSSRMNDYLTVANKLPGLSVIDTRVLLRELILLIDNGLLVGQDLTVFYKVSNKIVDSLERLESETGRIIYTYPEITSELEEFKKKIPAILFSSVEDSGSAIDRVKKSFALTQSVAATESDRKKFLDDFSKVVESRIDGLFSTESGKELKEFVDWLRVSVGNRFNNNSEFIALRRKLLTPITTSEVVGYILKLSETASWGESEKNKLKLVLGFITSGASISRLSLADREAILYSLNRLSQIFGSDEAFQNLLKTFSATVSFSDFIIARRSEIRAHSDQNGLWDPSLDGSGLTADRLWDGADITQFKLAYTIELFWSVLSRWREWRPSRFVEDKIPLLVLLREVKASLDDPRFADERYRAIKQEVDSNIREVAAW